ncbi:EamA family transporter [Candidatus Aalborgicola defluviihabitans]|uniref:EamA family transporter n=1 Tax=Candidatus Aalborgicola defluviihabitans TaxID=3386187 RepID=UPI0039B98CD6
MQLKGAYVFLLTLLAMLAFAANSLLCRFALKSGTIDPASFAAIRLMSGAAMLVVVMRLRGVSPTKSGGWVPAFWLAAYAATFSFAYVSLPAGIGALLLFGSVQATMVGTSLWQGERLSVRQWLGLLVAIGGLIALLLPGLRRRAAAQCCSHDGCRRELGRLLAAW